MVKSFDVTLSDSHKVIGVSKANHREIGCTNSETQDFRSTLAVLIMFSESHGARSGCSDHVIVAEGHLNHMETSPYIVTYAINLQFS